MSAQDTNGSSPAAGAVDFESQLTSYTQRVAPLLTQAVPDREPKKYLYGPMSSHLSRAGKGLRPALCLATCGAFGGDLDQALPSAVAIELLHNAFLVHDDIEDASEFRRGKPTMHREYGVPLAVNAGDAMNALSLRVLKRNLSALGPELA